MLDQNLINDFGKRIRQLRTDRGLSQEHLASSPPASGGVAEGRGGGSGFHRTYIGMVEHSKV